MLLRTTATGLLLFAVALPTAILVTGCGSQAENGTTEVTLFLTSSDSDLPIGLTTYFSSLKLTSKSGQVVTLLDAEQGVEAIHAQASPTPILTVEVPQGTYNSAQIADDGILWKFITWQNGFLDSFTSQINGDGGSYAPQVTLAQPITISGDSMALTLDLNFTKSEFDTGVLNAAPGIADNFTLTAGPLPAVEDVMGKVSAVSASDVTLSTLDGASLSVSTTGTTSFSGATGLSGLTTQDFVAVDGQMQSDGSLVASRVQVIDTSGNDVLVGPIIQAASASSEFFQFPEDLVLGPNQDSPIGSVPFSEASDITFAVSSRFTNLNSLPFNPVFSAETMSAGQNIAVAAPSVLNGPTPPPVDSMTLLPQTIDGTVTGVSSEGDFEVYSVLLSQDDSYAAALSAANPANTSTVPTTVFVYASNATVSAAPAVEPGATMRFDGLLFDDNGTMRMDCDAILAGVPE